MITYLLEHTLKSHLSPAVTVSKTLSDWISRLHSVTARQYDDDDDGDDDLLVGWFS